MCNLNKKYISQPLLALLFLFGIEYSYAQLLPDTLHYIHNSNVVGAQWMFTAVQITDIHLGESSPNGDYGTTGWNDTIDQNTDCDATEHLRNVVQWINANKVAEKIEIVFVTGDLSDRGEKSGFIMSKRILDSLTVPYVVTNGNHDMWPRVSGDEAPYPFGDSIFSEVFKDHFIQLSQQLSNWDDGTRLNRVFNPLNNTYSQFQNFSFSKGSYWFIVSDFASRYKKPLGVGTMVDAALYDIPGGSYPWLANALAQAQPAIVKGIILLQHFPLDNEILSSTYSFSSTEYDSIIDLIEPYAASFGLCIAGHRHRSKTYDIKRSTFSPVLGEGIETDANYKYANGYIRLIQFWDYPTAGINNTEKKHCSLLPNPFNDKTTLIISRDIAPDELCIEISNINGQKVRSYNHVKNYEIEIMKNDLKAGLYFINIRNNKFSETIKLIVN